MEPKLNINDITSRKGSYMNMIFGIPIAVVYGFLFTKMIDLYLEQKYPYPKGYEKGYDSYFDLVYYNTRKPNHEADAERESTRKIYEEMRKHREDEKFIFSMVGGVLGIIVGVLITIKAKKLNVAGMSIGFGGVLLLIYQLFHHWYQLENASKVIVLGLAFMALIGGSYVLLN